MISSAKKPLQISVYVRLLRYFVLGLALFLIDTALDLTVSSKYLDMRECFKTISQSFTHFDLSELLRNETTEDSPIPGFFKNSFYMHLREDTVQALPLHWAKRVNDIVHFQIVDITPVSESCTFNGEKFDNFADLGLDLCEEPLRNDSRTSLIRSFWDEHVVDEDELLHIFLPSGIRLGNDTPTLLTRLASTKTMQALNLTGALRTLNKVVDVLTKEELALAKEFITDWGPDLPGMAESLSQKLNTSDVDKVRKAFGKIKAKNLPEIQDSLAQLNVSLTELITDPLLFFQFLSDKEKAAILTKIQKLLPDFYPSEVNAILQIKKAFDETPRVNELIADAFNRFSIEFFMKFLGLGFSKSDEDDLLKAFSFFKREEVKLKGLLDLMVEKGLFTFKGQSAFLKKCSKSNFDIHCINRKTDLCPNGHISFGVLTLAAMTIPGILFGLSEFVHFKHFRFGELYVCGREWSMLLKLCLLPIYVFVMIPFFFIITIWNYIKIICNIFLDLLGREDNTRFTTGLGLYIKFQSLEGMGEGFIQIIIQLYFLSLLVFFGTGTLIAGIHGPSFLSNVFGVTVASVVLSFISLVGCIWGLYDYDRKAKNLFLEDKLSVKWTYRISSGLWIFVSLTVKIISILLLCLLTWVEVFSESLTATGSYSLNFGRILPFLNVGIFPIFTNIFLHSWYLNNEDSFAFAHGVLSAIFPSRFIHPDKSINTKSFLFFNQLTEWGSHVGAWLVFCLTVYSHHIDDFAFSNIFLPMLALLSLSPSLAALHWALSLRELYVLDEDETIPVKKIPRGRKQVAYFVWQGLIFLSRLTSFILLFYVFSDNYREVRIGSFRLGLWHLIPYISLIIISNAGIHAFLVQKSSVAKALFSVFLPNDFRRIRKLRAREYVLINTVYNGVLWALTWLFMTFYCWECTKILSIPKLIPVFPTITILWLLQWGLTILAWKFVIEPSYDEDVLEEPGRGMGFWPSKVYSMTTAL